ncbi:MAG TPA: hypothetical protein VHB97_02610 [Polyangia bacterium]|nr:hypothetical protein [Polyangia bacterium]
MTLFRSSLILVSSALLAACAPQTGNGIGIGSHGPHDMAGGPVGGDDGGAGDGGAGAGSGDMATNQTCMLTCQAIGASCGVQGNGCGGQMNCGSCTAPDTCGGGGTLNACGKPASGGPGGPCVAKTCAQLGFNCGPAGDGCGNQLNCWPAGTTSCPNSGDICGGGGMPGVCGGGTGAGGGGCTGPLCPATCPAGTTTTIEGYVYAPTPPAFGAPDPLPHALVYIPTTTLSALPAGASCAQCTPASGNPVAYTTSDDTGHFVLTNTPAGAAGAIPLVVQLGKWRREVNLSVAITKCVSNKLTNIDDTRLPRKQGDGIVSDIPKIAVVTGEYDSIECTLEKMGIDVGEFTNPSGTGRVSLYQNSPYGGSYIDSTTPDQETLLASPTTLDTYDMLVLDCIGTDQNEATTSDYQNVADYINKKGGRVFASHYSYTYLQNQFSTVASWLGDPNGSFSKTNVTSTIAQASTAGTPGFDLATWLNYVDNAAYAFGTFIANEVKDNLGAVNSSLVRQWITYAYSSTKTNTMEVTFDAPVGSPAAMQCGRVVYADFHVNSQDTNNSGTFSTFCATADPGNMTNQEKVLEYMLFDLSSCINPPPPPPPPMCTKTTCAMLGYSCGPAGDGCGGVLDCGTCTAPQTCGGGGTPGACGGLS